MDAGGLQSAIGRAERAIERIERALETARLNGKRDERLRERVRKAVADLDELISANG